MAEVQDIDDITTIDVQNDIQSSSKTFFYTWSLGNFINSITFSDAKIYSQEFEFAGAKWRLGLQAICKDEKLDTIKVRLVKSEKSIGKCYIKCKFILPTAAGSSVTRERISSFIGESRWGHRSSFKYREGSNNALSFIINNGLIINCELLALSSSQTNKDQTSISHTSNQSDKPVPKRKASSAVYSVLKLLFPISELFVDYTNNEIKRRPTRRMHVQEGCTPIRFELIFMILLLFLVIGYFPDESSSSRKFIVNMTEVNELIFDSTLKIRYIAEALNLSDVKMKSSELLAWYHENYNVSTINLDNLNEKISSFIYPHLILNASLNMHETSVAKNTYETVNNNEQ